MVKTAVLVSGGGTNLQALIDANISNPDAYALTRAERAGIPSYVVDISIFPNRASFCDALLKKLQDLDIELVVLAGFLYVLTPAFVKEFPNRMINIHPALIPSFCGDGYYGIHVHEKALEYGVKISGATAHFVTTATDSGPIILQKAVEVEENDTPKTLQRIMEKAEWIILPKAVSLFCEGRLEVNGRVVHIKEAENEN